MKTPLLLLHGALGSAAQFDKLLPLLPPDLPVYTLNFPGHGGTPLPDQFSMDAFATAVLDFLEEKEVAQVQIFGYSMGGYAALQLAARHPERVQRILTLGTKLEWTPEISAKEMALLNPEKIAEKVPVFAQLLADRHSPADWRDVVRLTAGLLHALGNGAALQASDFQAIYCPVLIGLGSEDTMVTEAESREVAALLAQGRFELLPGVKHPFEQVDPGFLAGWLLANAYPSYGFEP